jgi:hypothetical protein
MCDKTALAIYVELVVNGLVEELDPDEKIWPTGLSLAPLKADLEMAIKAQVADWELEQREAHGCRYER